MISDVLVLHKVVVSNTAQRFYMRQKLGIVTFDFFKHFKQKVILQQSIFPAILVCRQFVQYAYQMLFLAPSL